MLLPLQGDFADTIITQGVPWARCFWAFSPSKSAVCRSCDTPSFGLSARFNHATYFFHLHLRKRLAILTTCLPVATSVGSLALDDDSLATEWTRLANHWVSFG